MYRVIFLSIVFLSFSGIGQPASLAMKNPKPFMAGEALEFKLGYGWFTVGKANLTVGPNLEPYNGRQCYKVDISGKTAGLLGVFTRVDDSWGAFVDPESLLPYYSYSDINEGKYQRKDAIVYDREIGKIQVDKIRKHKQRPTKFYDVENLEEVFDLISGYLYLRSVDYSTLSINDTIRFNAFYDEILYDFQVVYKGIEPVKTKVGEINAHKLVPIMPENDIFPGETPITAWISADGNQLPLKIEAEMFFGSAYCELTSFKNIRYGQDFEQ